MQFVRPTTWCYIKNLIAALFQRATKWLLNPRFFPHYDVTRRYTLVFEVYGLILYLYTAVAHPTAIRVSAAISTGNRSAFPLNLHEKTCSRPLPAATAKPLGPFRFSIQPGNGCFRDDMTEDEQFSLNFFCSLEQLKTEL